MSFRLVSLVACFGVFVSSFAQAEDPVADARTVISGQIEALAADDADTAYSYASPDIKSLYPDKDLFVSMVRERYEAVYHAGNYAFGKAKLVGGGELVFQEVMISAKEGRTWTAIYEMRLMDDGSYKVNGVKMMPNSASQGI